MERFRENLSQLNAMTEEQRERIYRAAKDIIERVGQSRSAIMRCVDLDVFDPDYSSRLVADMIVKSFEGKGDGFAVLTSTRHVKSAELTIGIPQKRVTFDDDEGEGVPMVLFDLHPRANLTHDHVLMAVKSARNIDAFATGFPPDYSKGIFEVLDFSRQTPVD